MLREGTTVALLSLGGRLKDTLAAAEQLAAMGLSTTVADARFAKPLDTGLIRRLAAEHEVLVTIEEGSVGGFGAHVLSFMANDGLLESNLRVRAMTMPDAFFDQAKPQEQVEWAGLDAKHIVAKALEALGRDEEAAAELARA